MAQALQKPMSSERFNSYVNTGNGQQGKLTLERLSKDYQRYKDSLSVQEILPTQRIVELTVAEFRILLSDILKSAR